MLPNVHVSLDGGEQLQELINRFIGVSVPDRDKLDDMGLLSAISWLDGNYKMKGQYFKNDKTD